MKWSSSLLTLVLVGTPGVAQERLPKPAGDVTAVPSPTAPLDAPTSFDCDHADGGVDGFLTGNHNFPRFIGFMSNPAFNIEPRAVTELWPMFGSTWTNTIAALPSANMWIPGGAGLNVALSERLSLGINQGGY